MARILIMNVPIGDGKYENIPLQSHKEYGTDWVTKKHKSGHWWNRNRTTTYTNVLNLYNNRDGVIASYPEGEAADYVSRYISNLQYF